MLELNETYNIPTFVVLKVVFNLKPPILLAGVNCFYPDRSLLAWQCAMTGFESLRKDNFYFIY